MIEADLLLFLLRRSPPGIPCLTQYFHKFSAGATPAKKAKHSHATTPATAERVMPKSTTKIQKTGDNTAIVTTLTSTYEGKTCVSLCFICVFETLMRCYTVCELEVSQRQNLGVVSLIIVLAV